MGTFEFLSKYRHARMTAVSWALAMGTDRNHDTGVGVETMEEFIMREKYERGIATETDPESAG